MLEEDCYQEDAVRQWLTLLLNHERVRTTLLVDYQELYTLNEQGWTTHGGQVLSAQIKGLFRYFQVVRLQPLAASP